MAKITVTPYDIENNVGACTKCGEKQDGVEPDANGYKCESCDEHAVYGAAQLVLIGMAEVEDDGFDYTEEFPGYFDDYDCPPK